MAERSPIARLTAIVDAIELIGSEMAGVTLDAFEPDIRKRWIIERGIEIVSEASRHLPNDVKARHPDIPWRKVAGIGNVLRHNYEDVAAPIMWALVRDDLPPLEKVCREELSAERERNAALPAGPGSAEDYVRDQIRSAEGEAGGDAPSDG